MSATIIKVGEVGQLKFSNAKAHTNKINEQSNAKAHADSIKAHTGSICLIESTPIAGTSHVAGIKEITRGLCVGDQLILERDQGNLYDTWSVRVYSRGHVKLGYVSCDCNEVVARLIDGGKHVSGRLEHISQRDAWTRIDMGVYLDD